ncbi:MAG: hypothetical protein PHO37_18355 [Kiritimatiellae bacterium]|nr:hypothetical protein [Kiritimatiellia bacterium]
MKRNKINSWVILAFIAFFIIFPLLLELGPCSIMRNFAKKRMLTFMPVGIAVLESSTHRSEVRTNDIIMINNHSKALVSEYFRGGKEKHITNCTSSIYILGKFNLADPLAILGFAFDGNGDFIGIDITYDNATLQTRDNRLLIVNDNKELSKQIIEVMTAQIPEPNKGM